jgi:quercetin dioxygenase-like cupin family protein
VNMHRNVIWAVVLLWFPLHALPLDQSTAVKVTQLLKTTSSWNGTPMVYPTGQAEITGLLIEIAPGAATGWHLHPVPSFGLILAGTLEVTLQDGQVKRLHAGEAFAEVVHTVHNGHTVGDMPVKLVVFYAGAVGQPLTTTVP